MGIINKLLDDKINSLSSSHSGGLPPDPDKYYALTNDNQIIDFTNIGIGKLLPIMELSPSAKNYLKFICTIILIYKELLCRQYIFLNTLQNINNKVKEIKDKKIINLEINTHIKSQSSIDYILTKQFIIIKNTKFLKSCSERNKDYEISGEAKIDKFYRHMF
jgi:hypothetical protein